MKKRKIIVVTDGDDTARAALEKVGEALGVHCISQSAGNPTPLSGEELLSLIKKGENNPVLVMFDDKGFEGKGRGEQALEKVASDEEVDVIGAIVVASNTEESQGIPVHSSLTRDGDIIPGAVDKMGNPEEGEHIKVEGDTVDILNNLDIPVIIGIGDIGKMEGADDVDKGAPITHKAIQEVLNRSGS